MSEFLKASNRDLVDRLTYPLYGRIAVHIPRSVTPNAITIASFAVALAGVACLGFGRSPLSLVAAAGLLYLYTLLDSLDGIHARLTGQTSPIGHFLDHLFDTLVLSLLLFAVLVRFDLLSPLYVGLVLARLTLQAVGFLVEKTIGELPLPALGPVFETFCYIGGFLAVAICPFEIALAGRLPGEAVRLLGAIGLARLDVMRLLLLVYVPGILLAALDFRVRIAAHCRQGGRA